MRPVGHRTGLRRANNHCCFRVGGNSIRAYFHSFCTRPQTQLGIHLVLARCDVEPGNHIFLEALSFDFDSVGSGKHSRERVLPVALRGGLGDHSILFIQQPDTCSTNRSSRWILDRPGKPAVSSHERCRMGLRRELHALRQCHYRAPPVK